MSPIQAVALGVRLFAIWLAIDMLRWIPYLYKDLRRFDNETVTAIGFATSVLIILLVVFLWFFPRTVALRLLPGRETQPITDVSPDRWFAVGCALLGLWVLTNAIPALVQNTYVLFYTQRNQMSRPEGWDAAILHYLVELVIGVWLLLGASGARRLVWWARAGRFGS
jgi:hypothetical protein